MGEEPLSDNSEPYASRPVGRDWRVVGGDGEVEPQALVARSRARIEAREPDIMAWQELDWAFVQRQIDDLAARPMNARGVLYGLPVGVKDLFDTADLPTAYGSEIYRGHRPAADAAAVARLRAEGAIVIGKTVSTEFAYWKAGNTRNPLNPAHSPGGSSSGSAAAVADGMVPLAIGSQTAASTIRPAAYCGIVGFKPTRGLVSLAGAKALASSLDTIGVFASDVAGAALIAGALSGRHDWMAVDEIQRPPSLGLLRSPEWDGVSPACLDAVQGAADLATQHGARVRRENAPAGFSGLAEIQATIMAVEAAHDLFSERHHHFDRLSQPLRDLLTEGDNIIPAVYDDACRQRDDAIRRLDTLFGDADVLMAPSALGTAPLFEDGTGDPAMSRAWTLLGLPSISIPCGSGDTGLPLGLQLAARPGQDRRLIAVAAWLSRVLAAS